MNIKTKLSGQKPMPRGHFEVLEKRDLLSITTPQLLGDINDSSASSYPAEFAQLGEQTIFVADMTQSGSSGFYHTEGRFIVDAAGEKVVFRGVNTPGLESGVFDENFSQNPYPGQLGQDYYLPREEDIQVIQDLGFNVLRVPVEWGRLVTGWTPGTPVELDATYLSAMDQVVEMAARHDQEVIWEFHSYCKYWSAQNQYVLIAHNPDYQDLLAQTWRNVAAHYASNEAVLGYDIMNEPQTEEDASEGWHDIAQSVVNAIREVDTNHLILAEGPYYSHSGDWPLYNREPFIVDTITPPRIVYSPHVYFAYNNNKYTGPGEDTGPIDGWEYVVRDRLMPAIDWSFEYDVPILIGEAGAPCTAEWAGVLENAFNEYWEPLGISVVTWHYSDPAKRLDNLNLALYPESGMLDVLAAYPGGTYEQTGDFSPSLVDSPMYGDMRTNPWHIGEGFWGPVNVNYSNADPVKTGDYSLSCQFNEGWGGLKFVHQNGINTSRFDVLQFWLYPTSDTVDLRLFATVPDFGDDGSLVVEGYQDYPAYADRPSLGDYVSLVSGQWNLVRIPLEDFVPQDQDIITGIALQNKGSSLPVFYLDDITLAIEDPAPIELGKVDFKRLESLNPSSEDLWFRLETVHDGWLTAQAVAEATDDELTIRVFEPTNRAVPVATSAVQDGRPRFDFGVEQGQTYLLRMTGTASDVGLLLTNLVHENGTAITVYGTAEADEFSFDPGASREIAINGVAYHYEDTEVSTVDFTGGEGGDIAWLFDTSGDEALEAWPDRAVLTNGAGDGVADFMVNVSEIEDMLAYGRQGGTDTAVLHGSADADKFKSYEDYVRLRARSMSYSLRAKLYDTIVGDAGSDGKDVAIFNGSSGDETFRYSGSDNSVIFEGKGRDHTATGFESVTARAGGGENDVAYFTDIDNPETRDVLYLRAHKAQLGNGDLKITARTFDHVYATASESGYDVIRVYDTVGDDHLEIAGNTARLSTRIGDELKLLYEAVDFELAKCYSTEGDDTTDIHDPEMELYLFGWEK